MIWSKREPKPHSIALTVLDTQTRNDLKGLLLAALAGVVMALMLAIVLLAALVMTTPA